MVALTQMCGVNLCSTGLERVYDVGSAFLHPTSLNRQLLSKTIDHTGTLLFFPKQATLTGMH
jgi:hypothetical protein